MFNDLVGVGDLSEGSGGREARELRRLRNRARGKYRVPRQLISAGCQYNIREKMHEGEAVSSCSSRVRHTLALIGSKMLAIYLHWLLHDHL
jgi:hypothetical protein